MQLNEFIVLKRLLKDVLNAFLEAKGDELVAGNVRRTENEQRLLNSLPFPGVLIESVVQRPDFLDYLQSVSPRHLKIQKKGLDRKVRVVVPLVALQLIPDVVDDLLPIHKELCVGNGINLG